MTTTTPIQKQVEEILKGIDPGATVAISMRVPLRQAFLLQLYSEQMNTSTGKLMSSLFEDILPAFSSGNGNVTLRIPKVYKAMEHGDILTAVNPRDLQERVSKRGEGPVGRPRKTRRED